MRRLAWAVVTLALVWGGWWLWAAQAAERAVSGWFADRRTVGWQADYAAFDITGFPLRFDAVVRQPALADPQTGVAVTASRLDVSAPAWWPGDMVLSLPPDEIVLASTEGRATLMMDQATARLGLHPGVALALEQMTLEAGPWSLRAPLGEILTAADAWMAVGQKADGAAVYDITARVAGFRPGSGLRTRLRVPDSWPLTFDRFGLDMQVEFDRVWDRGAVEVARPQPRRIRLTLAEADWGRLSLRAAADLAVDAEGLPTGTLSLQVGNWQDMLTLAEAAGVLPAALLPQARSILTALAGASGDPGSIDAQLTLRGGLVLLGFVPLGQAPRLVLR